MKTAFAGTIRSGLVIFYVIQQMALLPGSLQAADTLAASSQTVSVVKLEDMTPSAPPQLSPNEDNDNPLSPATKEAAAPKVMAEAVAPLPSNAVATATNPNFYYAERNQGGSTPKVWDIYTKAGGKLFTIEKEIAPARGSMSKAIGVPDVSADGIYLIVGNFSQSFYTGHVIQTLSVRIYSTQTKQLVPPSIVLAEKDNEPFSDGELGPEIRFSPGSNFLIRVKNSNYGQLDYYSAVTHKSALPPNAVVTASNPNYYYAKRSQPGSVPEVYDIFTKAGVKLFTVNKKNAPLQGNYSYSFGVPDISPDGKHLALGRFWQSFYTGHVIQSLSIEVYNMQTKELETVIPILERDNSPIPVAQIPNAVRFNAGSSNLIKVTYASGKTEYYDLASRSKAAPAASNPNFLFVTESSNGNTNLYMIDIRNPAKRVLVGGGSDMRHRPDKYDVSPDGSTLIASYLESGPVVGDLSRIMGYRVSDLIAGIRTGKDLFQAPANAISIRFQGTNAIVTGQVRGPKYNQDGKDTVMKIISVPIPLK